MCRFLIMEGKVFSKLPTMVVLAMLLLGGRQAQESSSNNTMLFLAIGSTTRESGYGHVLVPIPLPTLNELRKHSWTSLIMLLSTSLIRPRHLNKMRCIQSQGFKTESIC